MEIVAIIFSNWMRKKRKLQLDHLASNCNCRYSNVSVQTEALFFDRHIFPRFCFLSTCMVAKNISDKCRSI